MIRVLQQHRHQQLSKPQPSKIHLVRFLKYLLLLLQNEQLHRFHCCCATTSSGKEENNSFEQQEMTTITTATGPQQEQSPLRPVNTDDDDAIVVVPSTKTAATTVTTTTSTNGSSRDDTDDTEKVHKIIIGTSTLQYVISSSSSTSSSSFDTKIGMEQQQQQYPAQVVTVLQNYPFLGSEQQEQQYEDPSYNNDSPDKIKNKNKKFGIHYDDDEDDDIGVLDDEEEEEFNQVQLASWYVDLGLAHRTVIEDYLILLEQQDGNVGQNDNDQQKPDVDVKAQSDHAMTNFREAMKIYQALIGKYERRIRQLITTEMISINELYKDVLQIYQGTLADTIFALAETYQLLNDDLTTLSLPYYYQAYVLYQKQQRISSIGETSNNIQNHNTINPGSSTSSRDYGGSSRRSQHDVTKVHFAHCSYQLGLGMIHSLTMDATDVAGTVNEYNSGNYDRRSSTGTAATINDNNINTNQQAIPTFSIQTLTDVIEIASTTGSLKLDRTFWTRFMTSINNNNIGMMDHTEGDTSDIAEHTLDSVRQYLLDNIFNDDDIEHTEQYMKEYIQIELAIQYFTESIVVFRNIIAQIGETKQSNLNDSGEVVDDDDESDNYVDEFILEYKQTLVNILQNLGSCIYSYHADLPRAVDIYEDAYVLYTNEILPSIQQQQQSNGRTIDDEVMRRHVQSTTNILFALAEMYFHLGQYEVSKERLRTCLLLHEAYQLQPPVTDPVLLTTTVDDTAATDYNNNPLSKRELLIELERALDEYYSLYKNGNLQAEMGDDMLNSDEYYYEKDDTYEADIHVSMGMLYMQTDKSLSDNGSSSNTLATSHFQQAIRLYEMSGEVSSSSMAIAKYNLFLLNLRDGDYRSAILKYNDAVEVLRKLDITDISSYEGYDDPSLLAEWKQRTQDGMRQYQRLKEGVKIKHNLQPKQSLIQVSPPKSSRSDTERSEDKFRKETAANGIKEDKPSMFVDLQHFLTLQQNHSHDDEL